MKSIVLITGSESRHAAYACALALGLPLAAVVVEKKRKQIDDNLITPVVEQHQKERKLAEELFFGSFSFSQLQCPLNFVETGEANSIAVYEWINSFEPDYVLLYGSSIIKDPILSRYEGRVINLHLGLSPYYKGAATLFWPVVHNELYCVGTTFHIASLKVDAGPLIHQVRPVLSEADNLHEIGCKAVGDSFSVAAAVIRKFDKTRFSIPQKQYPEAKVFRKKDFQESAILDARKNMENHILKNYLQNKNAMDDKYPIITCL